MKKRLGILVLLGGATAALFGTLFFLAGRIPPPPEPAAEDAETKAADPLVGAIAGLLGIEAGAADTTYRLVQEIVEHGEVEMSAGELVDVVSTAAAGDPDARVLLRHAEPLRVRFASGRVRIGTVIDLREVQVDEVGVQTREVIEKLRRYAAFLANRPLWVELDSAPMARDGDLDIGSDVTVRLGRLPLPSWLARALGFDQPLRDALLVDLRFLSLSHVEVRKHSLYLRAAPTVR